MRFDEFVAKVEEAIERKCSEAPVAFDIFPELKNDRTSLVLHVDADGAYVVTVHESSGTPESVCFGRAVEYDIPKLLKGSELLHLLRQAKPLVERIIAGIDEYWDGSRWRAQWSDDAVAANRELERLFVEKVNELEWATPVDEYDYIEDYINHWHAGHAERFLDEVERAGIERWVEETVNEEACNGFLLDGELLMRAIRELKEGRWW